jgi:hypothetical protein
MTDISPFSNGTQYLDWEASNCDSCSKSNESFDKLPRCDIQYALAGAYVSSGKVTEEIAKRMGYPGPLEYVWPCPEYDPPFEETNIGGGK